jgi:hypothetical protein
MAELDPLLSGSCLQASSRVLQPNSPRPGMTLPPTSCSARCCPRRRGWPGRARPRGTCRTLLGVPGIKYSEPDSSGLDPQLSGSAKAVVHPGLEAIDGPPCTSSTPPPTPFFLMADRTGRSWIAGSRPVPGSKNCTLFCKTIGRLSRSVKPDSRRLDLWAFSPPSCSVGIHAPRRRRSDFRRCPDPVRARRLVVAVHHPNGPEH